MVVPSFYSMAPRKRKVPGTRRKTNVVPPLNAWRQKYLLPPIKGPKIGPFQTPGFRSFSDFQIESAISGPLHGGEGQSYVLKASLADKTYAIKLFQFYNKQEGRFRFFPSDNELISDELLVGNLDPFYAECRAYGKLQEIYNIQGTRQSDTRTIAVPCYGYIFISQADVEIIASRFETFHIPQDEPDVEPIIRALVKQYMPVPGINTKLRSVRQMIQDIRIMNENGLYPLDIQAGNYRGGLIVDFGQALTEPSCVFDVVEKDIADGERVGGLLEFDEMIKEAGIRTRLRAYTEHVWAGRTRAGSKATGVREFVMLKGGDGKRARAVTTW